MAYIGSQSNGIKTEHEEIIATIGNVGVGSDTILFSIDTTNITNIDLLEMRFRPDPGELAANLDIIELRWNNSNLKTTSGESSILLYPSKEADGSYRYEPNHPPNLYFAEQTLHNHLSRKYSLSVNKLATASRLQTANILLRFRVTKYLAQQVELVKKFEAVFLNQ